MRSIVVVRVHEIATLREALRVRHLTAVDGSCFMPGNPSTALPPLCRETRPPQWLTANASTERRNDRVLSLNAT
ncbi:MAG: hypothetical protein QNJ63_20055 [Calothrix sp. MO_192.B10]|nr:hypothetical protein [Calothrix sp. MO_192.B10]